MKKSHLLLMLFLSLVLFSSCSDDDDDMVKMPEITGSLVVEDQMLMENMLVVSDVEVNQDGWIVLHRDNGSGAPVVPEIISMPVLVEAGSSVDIQIPLKDGVQLEDGETLWAMLHTDSGEIGVYEFNGTSGLDAPIMDDMGNIVMESFMVTVTPSGSVVVEDQKLMDGVVNVNSITVAQDSYVVVHASTDEGSPVVPAIISEPVYLEAGTYTDVQVPLIESAGVMGGDKLWVMLHVDTGTEEVYEFDGENGLDLPIMSEAGEIVMDSFTAIGASGSLTVSDQILMNNVVNVNSITVDQDSYVVIHASTEEGGPVVPEIISIPVYLEEGTYTNVEIPLKESAGVMINDKIWVMLHEDTGTEAVYEFDGGNGLDLPIFKENGDIVMSPLMITGVTNPTLSGTLVVDDQPLTDNMIVVNSVMLDKSGWVVVHADNGEGGPVVPQIISEPVYLEAGTHTDVEVMFTDQADVNAGDTVWIMLHNDTGVEEWYEFNGVNGLDLPLTDANGIIMTSIVLE